MPLARGRFSKRSEFGWYSNTVTGVVGDDGGDVPGDSMATLVLVENDVIECGSYESVRVRRRRRLAEIGSRSASSV